MTAKDIGKIVVWIFSAPFKDERNIEIRIKLSDKKKKEKTKKNNRRRRRRKNCARTATKSKHSISGSNAHATEVHTVVEC